MIELITLHNENEYNQNKELLEKITRRGPTAFKIFLEICLDKFPKAAYIVTTK